MDFTPYPLAVKYNSYPYEKYFTPPTTHLLNMILSCLKEGFRLFKRPICIVSFLNWIQYTDLVEWTNFSCSSLG